MSEEHNDTPFVEPTLSENPETMVDVETTATSRLEEEVEEFKNKYVRTLAEMENMRKRLNKEKQEMIRFGVDNVIAEILAPLDNLEKALQCAESSSPEIKNWALGFNMIVGQFREVLSQNGVSSFDSLNALFDPFFHEAVEAEETDEYLEGTIIQEFVKGYRCGDRIIRPARVKVAKKKNIKLIKENQHVKQKKELHHWN